MSFIEGSILNETISGLFERKSVREFTDEEIPREAKSLILRAAFEAPTAGNQQLYTIIDVTSQELKDALSHSCDEQPFIAKAKLVLVFCADCLKWHDAYALAGCEPRAPGAGDIMLAVTDAAIAAQNAVAAAHSLGIGSCYIGDIMENCELNRELLGLPEHVFPAVMLVMGYPTQSQLRREKPKRFDPAHIVHENGYRRMDETELREMFSRRAGAKGFEAWMRAFCERKYNSGFSREMTRSVNAYLSQFRPRDQWLKWASELQAIAQTGLAYGRDEYDIERFRRVRGIAAELMAMKTDAPLSDINELFCSDTGYPTPKLDTRAAIIKDGKILLVREKSGKWTLPGGWVDNDSTIAENTVKEALEEAGVMIEPVSLIAVQDRNMHNTPKYALGICKVFMLCREKGGAFAPNIETTGSGYFAPDELPELDEGKSTREQVLMCFEAAGDPNWRAQVD